MNYPAQALCMPEASQRHSGITRGYSKKLSEQESMRDAGVATASFCPPICCAWWTHDCRGYEFPRHTACRRRGSRESPDPFCAASRPLRMEPNIGPSMKERKSRAVQPPLQPVNASHNLSHLGDELPLPRQTPTSMGLGLLPRRPLLVASRAAPPCWQRLRPRQGTGLSGGSTAGLVAAR